MRQHHAVGTKVPLYPQPPRRSPTQANFTTGSMSPRDFQQILVVEASLPAPRPRPCRPRSIFASRYLISILPGPAVRFVLTAVEKMVDFAMRRKVIDPHTSSAARLVGRFWWKEDSLNVNDRGGQPAVTVENSSATLPRAPAENELKRPAVTPLQAVSEGEGPRRSGLPEFHLASTQSVHCDGTIGWAGEEACAGSGSTPWGPTAGASETVTHIIDGASTTRTCGR